MSLNYFNTLNYTLANEDTSLELGITPKGTPHVMSVAGSGSRALSLLAKNPGRLTCVDVSQEQLYLTELRFESMRALSHEEFLAFWGYPPRGAEPEERKSLFKKITLSPKAKTYFKGFFKTLKWESILYAGKWERAIAKLSRVNRRITGLKGLELFSNLTYSEHKEYLSKHFPKMAWNITLTLLGQAYVFNSVLYKGSFPKKNIPERTFDFYSESFKRAFELGPARENFLLQLIFFGRILFAEGNPIECQPDVFQAAKKGLETTDVRYVSGNILDCSANTDVPIDILSLSDVPSYFSGTTEKVFMQEIRKGLSPDALVIIRNYLRVPEGTDLTGFDRVTSQFQKLIDQEKVQLYKVDVFRNGNHLNELH